MNAPRMFLRTEQQYANAPVGTEVGPRGTYVDVKVRGRWQMGPRVWPKVTYRVTKRADGDWWADDSTAPADTHNVAREVLRWGRS